MKILRTYNPLKSKNVYVILIFLLIIVVIPLIYVAPTTKNIINVFSFYLIFVVLLFLIGIFYKFRYNGGAEINVTNELAEIKFSSSKRKIFPINSINKIL